MIHIIKSTLACYYQEQAGAGSYDTEDKIRRNAAKSQLGKKEAGASVDKEAMQKAFDRYVDEQKKEFKEYLESLRSF